MNSNDRITFFIVIKTLYTWLLVSVIVTTSICLLLLLYPFALIFKDKIFGLASKIIKFFIKLLFFLFIGTNFKIDLSSIFNNKPKKGESRIFILTHASFFDPLLMHLLPGNLRTLVKKKYANIPILGLIVKMSGGIEVDSKTKSFDNNTILNTSSNILDKGCNLVVFPEGTRSRNGQIGRYKNGVFKIAYFTHSQIVPIIIDSWYSLIPGQWWIRDTKVVMHSLNPISYEEYKNIDILEFKKILRIKMSLDLLKIRDIRRRADKKYYRNKEPYYTQDQEEKIRLLELQNKFIKPID